MVDELAGGEEAVLNTETALGSGSDDPAQPASDETALGTAAKEGADGEPAKEGADKQDEGGEGEGAPEAYEDFTMPEGMEVDTKSVEKFSPLFKELNLSQSQAQRLVDTQAALVKEAAENQISEWNNIRSGWLESARGDEEIGGDKFDGTLASAGAAIREYGTPELVKAMDELGIGNHPEIIRFVSRIGKDLGEGTIHTSRQAGEKKGLAERLYPSMNK